MKIASIVAAAGIVMMAVPARAQTQTPPPPQPPAQPAQQPPAQPAPPAARPFPAGAKVAIINLQRVAAESAEGKAANAKAQALNQKKVTELAEKNKGLQAAQQKLSAGTLLTEEARAQIQKEIERLNLDIQRFTQDAQAEVEELQQKLQVDFQRKVMPIIELVAVDKGIQIVFAQDAGSVWIDQGLDLTTEVIRRFDAAMGAAPPKRPEAEPVPSDRRLSR